MPDRSQTDREFDWQTGRDLERKDAEIDRLRKIVNDLNDLRLLAADWRYSSEAIGIAFRNRFPPTDTGSVT